MKRDATGLQISLDVDDQRVVVLGGGAEAEDKVGRLLDGGARVTVFAEGPGERILALATAGRIELLQRPLVDADLDGARLVLVCERDAARAALVQQAAHARGATVWAADDPAHSDLAMPALARLGRARIAVTTSGAAPALASLVRVALERDLGERFAALVERLGRARERLFVDEPDPERRRERLRRLLRRVSITVRLDEDTD